MAGESAQETEFRGSDWVRPWWQSLFDMNNPGSLPGRIQAEYGGPNAFQYQGQRVAQEDPWHDYAATLIGNINANPNLQNAENWINMTMTGQNTQGPGLDWQNKSWRNEYEGNSPAFERMLAAQKDRITEDFKAQVKPAEATAATMAGAFGGGAHLQQQQMNQDNLNEALGDLDAQMRNDQFNRSAQLQEGRINRTSQMWGDERNRQANSIQQLIGMQDSRLRGAGAAMGVGDLYRGINQQNLDALQQQWWEGKMGTAQYIEMLMSVLQRGSGMAGSTLTRGSGASPWAGALGAGLAGYGLLS